MGIRQKPQDGIREGAGHLPRRRPRKRGGCGEARQHDDKSTLAGGTEAIARETPAGSLSVASMPQRKDYTNDAEHHGKFQVWLQAGSFEGKARDGAAVRAEHAAPLGSHVWLSL